MRAEKSFKKQIQKNTEKSGAKEKLKKGQAPRSESTKTTELAIMPTKQSRQLDKDYGHGTENHIVPLEPSQTYIFRDFLQTNNILNESMSILKEQNKSLVQKVSEARESEKEDALRIAAHETQQNAHALAQIVQAKVAYIKAVKVAKK